MKKLLLISMLIGAMPLAMMAQDDDLYFVAKKKKASKVEQVKEYAPVVAPQPKAKSSYEVIDGDTTKLDVIDFAEVKGVYPSDTLETEDYALTKKMMRFDDYDVSSNAAFWAGYNAGRSTWLTWHSPWYYSRYGLYEPWYNSYWYNYSPWYYSWYDPWYYGWYDPYYSSWGWPYYGYHSWYSYYWHGGYYDPYYYGGGGGGKHHYYGHTGNSGTIDVKGSTGGYRPAHRNTVTTNSQRMGSLRDRATSMGGGRVYTSGNNERSRSGNFSGYRGSSSNSSSASSGNSGNRTVYSSHSGGSSNRSSNGSFSSSSSSRSSSSSSSSGSFGGSRSSGSSGGGFSGGGNRGGTGGGSHMGGRR